MNTIKGFNVPDSWNDVTIKQLLELQKIEGADTKSAMQMIQVFNPDKDPTTLALFDMVDVAAKIYDFIIQTPQSEKVDSYSIDGIRYKIAIPETIDFQQFIDVQALHSTSELEQVKNLPLLISVLTENRPKEAKEWAEVIGENVSVSMAMGCVLFFSDCLQTYIKDTLHYSMNSEQLSEINTK